MQSVDSGGKALSFNSLPLDYDARGRIIDYAYSRTGWDSLSTVVNLQLVGPPVEGHEHLDAGNWQIWKNKRWLIHEVVGRAYSGYFVPGWGGSGSEDIVGTIAHNCLLFGGNGHDGGGKVTRMESQPNYFYAVVDQTSAYSSNATHVEREFLFIRPLQTLVIFDRMVSSKIMGFVAHYTGQPTVDGTNSYSRTNGTETVRISTLLPATPTFRIINENRTQDNLYREEIETSGSGVQYFLNVVQAKSSTDANLSFTTSEDASSYTITISHPSQGTAKLVLQKGQSSTGGTFGYAASGNPVLTALKSTVQTLTVTDNGPVWESAGNVYNLTVNSGTGSGVYTEGTAVNIIANIPPSGKAFDKWTGSTSGIANVNASSTIITLPSSDVTITATYKNTTGLENDIISNVAYYPNPVHDMIHINQNGSVSIYDLNGILQIQRNNINDQSQIDLSHLSNGIYIIKIINRNGLKIGKLIKE
jgi:hypothetical protein